MLSSPRPSDMSPRPEYIVGDSASLYINVPSGWIVTITGVSRERYNQAVSITHDIYGKQKLSTIYIGNTSNKALTSMKRCAKNTDDSTAIKAQSKDISLDLKFYYSKMELSFGQTAKDIAVPDNLCSSIYVHVHEVTKKTDKASPTIVPYHIIYTVFVEDEGETAYQDSYQNAVTTIHLSKKMEKPTVVCNGTD